MSILLFTTSKSRHFPIKTGSIVRIKDGLSDQVLCAQKMEHLLQNKNLIVIPPREPLTVIDCVDVNFRGQTKNVLKVVMEDKNYYILLCTNNDHVWDYATAIKKREMLKSAFDSMFDLYIQT